ncbi:MAG: hypothetical protein ACK4UO_11660 [Pseudolabrys sp.]
MLAATRDPMRHGETQAPPVSHDNHRLHAPEAPRAPRFMTALQMTGSLLAIPVALGSAYSVYKANFSPEVQCQTLRAGIIAMIDRNIDAAARRMLVRRDVETFETTCGAFDPDAKAAFVSLLAEPRPAAAPPKAAPAKAQKAEAPKPEAANEVKSDAKVDAAPVPKRVAVAKAALAEADAANADARWLAAVRGALVSHASPAPAPAAKPLGALVVPAASSAAAPVLPPAEAVAPPAPSEHASDPDRPVPPATIPEAASRDTRSTWLSNIPFVGQVLDR